MNLKNLLMLSEIVESTSFNWDESVIIIYEILLRWSFYFYIQSIFQDASFRFVMSFIQNFSSAYFTF